MIADDIAIIVANFSAIIPKSKEYIKYEQIAIITVASIGFITNLLTPNFILIVFFKAIIEIPNATRWHATDAIAAPLTPIAGIGTRIKFKINFTITPAS